MAVTHREHLSGEVGHTAGAARMVLAAGLLVLGLGVALFVFGLLAGMLAARDGGAGDSSVRLFALGGGAAVIGLLVSAVGMAWARHDAGE